MKRKSWLGVGGSIAGAIAILAGCNAVLGIDEAKLEPSVGAGDAAVEGGPASCPGYCATIMKNCTGDNQEYTRIETCVAMCQHLEPGLPGDISHDSLECRNYHAGAATGDPKFHCRHAGPTGGGHCGTDVCAPYCLLDIALCGGMATPPFAGGEQGCHNECAKFLYLQSDAGDLTLTEKSDTLNCRVYHLEAAYDPTNPTAATTHCPHTATISATCSVPTDGGTSDAAGD